MKTMPNVAKLLSPIFCCLLAASAFAADPSFDCKKVEAGSIESSLGATTHSLCAWIKKYGRGQRHAVQVDDQQAENKLR